jgi:nucleoid DNA-binding protein
LSENRITNKQLVKLVAKSSGYKEYEVKDILKHLAFTVQTELVKGSTVAIRGLGRWKAEYKEGRTWYNGYFERQMVQPADYTVIYNLDRDISQSVKKDSVIRKALGEVNE